MTAVSNALAALARISMSERSEVWISVRSSDAVVADAEAVERRLAAGEHLPLAGVTVAVKDNIDVAGMPTTAACPAFAFIPSASATCVQRLVAAGAVVIGKTNLDQFATGLVGTRSPYGPVRDARRPEFVSGGSSSGSAVAVALEQVDIGIGTDTAGSGRVPAAFQGIWGMKPTRGLIGTAGVVPACRTLDCVSAFTRDLELGRRAMAVMSGGGRRWPADAPLAAPSSALVAVPAGGLEALSAAEAIAFEGAVERLVAAGHRTVAVDIEPFMAAGRLLYGGAFIAERYAAVGSFIAEHPDEVDPVVAGLILPAAEIPAHRLAADGALLEDLAAQFESSLQGADALLLPTATRQPTIAQVAADPVGANAKLGIYTTAVNLLDLCAVAAPCGEADGGQFGVSLIGRAFSDELVADLAGDLAGVPRGSGSALRGSRELLVVGAHRSGQPLNGELTALGGRFLRTAWTAPEYRLYRLDTDPPKPGLVRVGAGGRRIEGEVWSLPVAGLGAFVAALPQPMALGRVTLEDGGELTGFTCEQIALEGAQEISEHGSWPAYLASGLARLVPRRLRAPAGSFNRSA